MKCMTGWLKAVFLGLMCLAVGRAFAEPVLALSPGDHVVWIGNTLAERMQEYGHLETRMHARFPEHKLVVRNLAWSADTVSLRPRPDNFGDVHHYLSESKADVILACYGLNETWDYEGEAGLERFGADLAEFLKGLLAHQYNGDTAPRIVLFSPIACEDVGVIGDVNERNRLVSLYVKRMASVAENAGVGFVDLFTLTHACGHAGETGEPLTRNGVHLTNHGYRVLAERVDAVLFGGTLELSDEQRASIQREVLRKNQTFFEYYRAVNSVHIHGRRVHPFGVVNFPNERKKLLQMVDVRDARIWSAARGEVLSETVDDSGTIRIPATVPENREVPAMPTPEQSQSQFTLSEGFEVNLFASEREFPDLKNPSSMLFDEHGRLWVSTMPSYPQVLPGRKANDKILIFEDTDADGRADKQTVFADGLYLPLGFELGYGGVFVSQEPNLVFLQDTDGDGKSDHRHIALSGFGTEDSHHAIHDFVWDAGGGLHMQESVFLHSQIETPHGPQRLVNAGVYRFDPRTQTLDISMRLNGGGNAWGHSIDRWGAHLFVGHYLNPAMVNQGYPGFHAKTRKTTEDDRFCEQEFITSKHFPDAYQGKVFSNIYKHYHGIRLHDWTGADSGYQHDRILDVLKSSDTSHIPVDMCLGPDGALYVTDWFNRVLGHAQASIRQVKRDHDHGRIWRITYKGRPLATPPALAGRSAAELLDFLKAYEDRTRYRARRLLWQVPDEALRPALAKWVSELDAADADVAHQRMEALWLHQQRGWVNADLLSAVLQADDPYARAAATDLLRFWWRDVPHARDLFLKSAEDSHARVRLAAVVAATWASPDIAVDVLGIVRALPQDADLELALGNATKALEPLMQRHPLLVTISELETMPLSEDVINAIMLRPDVPDSLRTNVMAHRATTRAESTTAALIDIVSELDQRGEPSLARWLTVLDAQRPGALGAAASTLATLRDQAAQPETRQAVIAALVRSGQKIKMQDADYFFSIARIAEADLRGSYAENAIKASAGKHNPVNVRRAALLALGYVPGDDVEHFARLSGFLDADELASAAADALLTRTSDHWPVKAALAVLGPGFERLKGTAVTERGTARFADVSRLLTEVAKFEGASVSTAAIAALQLNVIVLRPVPNLMEFEQKRFEVTAGTPVELRLVNVDQMAHNAVIVKPGTLEKVGLASDIMAAQPDAAAKEWVPDVPDVLWHTPLVEAHNTGVVRFVAPEIVGEYPYLCSVPGHWRLMKGVMIVKR
ncbi:MAG: glucose/arabinose dehydrogenase/azurin/lysophospholipase L1-like esterase [Candidatus Promineifilaceae bacterium]|jgi:glucose/arabinose dehydrogenase/azurin/lysophospholipase L1-like esterase